MTPAESSLATTDIRNGLLLEEDEPGISLYDWGTLLLGRRRLIIGLAVLGGFLGLASGLLSPRLYKTPVTFLPQGSPEGISSLALAASQFGFNLPKAGTE